MPAIEIREGGGCTFISIGEQDLVLFGDETEALAAALDAHLQEKEHIEREAQLLATAPYPSTLTHY